LFIYLYQIHGDNIIYNSELKKEIFYEGLLQRNFELGKYEEIKFYIKLYPLEQEEIFTNCLIVDANNSMVFMSPLSKSIILNKINIE
jgi:hypothetical protein